MIRFGPDQYPEEPIGGKTPDVDDTLQGISRPVDSPDLTEPIMHRLGMRHISADAARQGRRRSNVIRVLTMMFMVGAMVVAARLHEESNRARRPVGRTIDSAITSDANTYSETVEAFGDLVRVISDRVDPNRPVDPAFANRDPRGSGAVLIGSEPINDSSDESPVPWSGLL